MTDPRFSIIIPVYKVEPYLRQCVDSVLTQSYIDFELILVDDGSPDDCPSICNDYAAQDSRVRVIHKPNGGLSDARNAGLSVAQGEYVLFLDSDDWWDDVDALRKLNSCITDSDAEVVIFGIKKYFTTTGEVRDIRVPSYHEIEEKNSTAAQLLQKSMKRNIFVACACDKAIRRKVLSQDFRFVKGQLSEDIEWCCKILLAGLRITVLNHAFYVYRQQVSTSISANVTTRNIISILGVIKKYARKETPELLLHFMANQYVLLITNMMRLEYSERKQLEPEIKEYWWLLKYNLYPYVRKVSKVSPLGFDVTKTLLRLYYRTRR